VSQILNGDFNHRIATFVDLSLAIGKVPKIELEDLNELINNVREGYEVKKWKIVVRRNPQSQTIEPTGKTEIENKIIIKGDWCQAVTAY